ncbi:hypothetical protein OG814_05165 [Streptomyces zaomyceticus]|uniref:DUF305 domain-containing protein n=1 Tax=Streptomyces zaomyceticus TaxID=68286 RepID=A0ABZ1L5R4_9ACTN
MNDLNAKGDAESRNSMVEHFENGENQMYAMMRQVATDKGLDPDTELDVSPGEYEDGLQPTADQWYQNGVQDAQMEMGQP